MKLTKVMSIALLLCLLGCGTPAARKESEMLDALLLLPCLLLSNVSVYMLCRSVEKAFSKRERE